MITSNCPCLAKKISDSCLNNKCSPFFCLKFLGLRIVSIKTLEFLPYSDSRANSNQVIPIMSYVPLFWFVNYMLMITLWRAAAIVSALFCNCICCYCLLVFLTDHNSISCNGEWWICVLFVFHGDYDLIWYKGDWMYLCICVFALLYFLEIMIGSQSGAIMNGCIYISVYLPCCMSKRLWLGLVQWWMGVLTKPVPSKGTRGTNLIYAFSLGILATYFKDISFPQFEFRQFWRLSLNRLSWISK